MPPRRATQEFGEFFGYQESWHRKNMEQFLLQKIEGCIFQKAQDQPWEKQCPPFRENLSNHEIRLLVAFESFYPNPNQKYAPMTM